MVNNVRTDRAETMMVHKKDVLLLSLCVCCLSAVTTKKNSRPMNYGVHNIIIIKNIIAHTVYHLYLSNWPLFK